MEFINSPEIYRFGFFLSILFSMIVWEVFSPRRKLSLGRSRWKGNLAITAINSIFPRFIFPVLPVSMAEIAVSQKWGVFNILPVPEWVAFTAGIIILDLVIYLQHTMFHGLPSLWRVHMMHHADHDIDVTTGLRFHPLEIIISLLIKLMAVILLGIPAPGVLAFEIILNGMSMFNHGNVHLPAGVDRVLRLIIVTPDMHRVHHSVAINETNSNFGFSLSWWDYLFGTYKNQPAYGHIKMVIGVSHLREIKWQKLLWMLVLPFRGKTGPYPLGRHGHSVINSKN